MRQSFFSIKEFPKLEFLARNWETIRHEFLELQAPTLEIVRNGTHDEVVLEYTQHLESGKEPGWVLGWSKEGLPNKNWIQYGLIVNDKTLPFTKEKFPKTIELLSSIKGIRVCGLAKMKAHTFLSTHRHPELLKENLLQLHITLDAPLNRNYCYLNVKGKFFQHKNGLAIVFDGSFDHFAINASNHDRTILYMEFHKDQLHDGNNKWDKGF